MRTRDGGAQCQRSAFPGDLVDCRALSNQLSYPLDRADEEAETWHRRGRCCRGSLSSIARICSRREGPAGVLGRGIRVTWPFALRHGEGLVHRLLFCAAAILAEKQMASVTASCAFISSFHLLLCFFRGQLIFTLCSFRQPAPCLPLSYTSLVS